MSITAIKRDFSDQPNMVRMEVTDSLADVETVGYLESHQDQIDDINGGTWVWYASDLILIYASDGLGLFVLNSDLDEFVVYVQPGDSGVTAEQVQNNSFNKGIDIGVADAYIVELAPPDVSGGLGMPVALIVSNNNLTSTPTLDAGFGPILITLPNSAPLSAGDISTSQTALFILTASSWILLNPQVSSFNPQSIQNNDYVKSVDTGAVNAYQVTLSPAPLSYADNLLVIMTPANTNTSTSASIDVNLLGPTSIFSNPIVGAIQPGDIIVDVPAVLLYSASNGGFQLLNPQSATQISSSITTNTYNFAIATDTGTDDYEATIDAIITSNFTEGTEVYLRIATTNTTNSPFLAVTDAIAESANGNIIDSNGNPLLPGQLLAGKVYGFILNSAGDWVCSNPSGMANVSSFAGDPNTNVAGNLLSSLCIDTTNDFLYYCSASGDAAGAVWTKIVM